jgi:Tfp pilus assembly protein PilO
MAAAAVKKSPTGEQKPKTGAVEAIGSHPVFYALTLIIVAGVLAFYFAIVPAVRALQPGGASSVDDAIAARAALNTTVSAQLAVIDKVASISTEDRHKISLSLPSEQDVPGMISELAGIASSSGVVISGMDLTATDSKLAPDVPSGVKPLDIVLNVQGVQYVNLRAFLANVEHNLRLIDFHGITVSPSVGVASVNFRTYYVTAP